MSNSLALRIAGTKQRQAGFSPLLNIGIFPVGEGEKMDRAPLVTENPVFIFKHTAEYILYMLIDCRVKAFDTSTSGILSIALTIPRENLLADGKSPYSLLMEVYECFRIENMTPMNDGRYCFIDQEADENPFREILEKYTLEDRKGTYVEMSPSAPTGIVCVPQLHLESFFKDTQYPEFRSYQDIEVGVACKPSPGLSLLDIPRVTRYSVYLNGERTSRTLAYPEDRFESDLINTPTLEYGKVSFCLQDLLSAPGRKLSLKEGTVSLDELKSAIYCNVSKKEIQYVLRVQMDDEPVQGKMALLRGIRENKIALKLGGKDITSCLLGSGKQTISANDVNQMLSFSPGRCNGYQMRVKSDLDRENRIWNVRVLYEKIIFQQLPTDNYSTRGEYEGSIPPPKLPMRKDPESPSPKPGINWLSLGLGVLIGLLIGAGVNYFFIMGREEPRRDVITIPVKQYDSLTIIANKFDEIASQLDSLKKLQSLQVSEIFETTTGSTGTPTPINNKKENQEDNKKVILDMINKGTDYSYIKANNSFNKLNSKDQYAIYWIFDVENATRKIKKDNIAKFTGDTNKDFDSKKAKAIRDKMKTAKETNYGKWTWDKIYDTHKIVLNILNK